MDRLTFKRAIGEVFRDAGFERKGALWRLTGDDIIVVFCLDKSGYADKYYLDVGLWFRAMGEVAYPRVLDEACTLEGRAEGMFPELLDFLRGQAIPFLPGCRNMDGVRAYHAAGRFSGVLVTAAAKGILAAA